MGQETSKSYRKRIARGDFTRFLRGRGLDVGGGDDPLIVPWGSVRSWDREDGDAARLSGIGENSLDFLYSSHCLEHLPSVEIALANWVRVVRPGGALYLTVPDYSLYEKEYFPSRYNPDHRQTFSLHLTREDTGRPTHWNVARDLAPLLDSLGCDLVEGFLENDHYDYSLPAERDQTHDPRTLAQICLIAVKRGTAGGKVGPLRIYTGILGQIGDIVMFTPMARRLKQIFPESILTFAVSRRFEEAGRLVAGLPYVDRLFVTESYFERLPAHAQPLWQAGWPVDPRGEDELIEQREHDLVFETRPRSRRMPWWEQAHQVEEMAHMIGVPGPIDLQTEIAIPAGTSGPPEARGRLIVHNDPAISGKKAWDWGALGELARQLGPERLVLLGNPGPRIEGVLDLRGKTTLAEAAAVIRDGCGFLGIDSGLMWIAASLKVPVVGLYGTTYIPAYGAIQPMNPQATYLQAEGSPNLIAPSQVLEALHSQMGLGVAK
jgi:SAM-dependent methyltransferase